MIEKYDRNRKCKFKEPQLFSVEVPVRLVIQKRTVRRIKWDEPCISINALSGAFIQWKVVGLVNDKPLYIMIDSRSTHNFLDLSLARKLGVRLSLLALNPSLWLMKIILLVSTVIRSSIGWMNRREFAAEVMLISSWDCDMVLGVQWLSNLGQIKWDFKELFMQFELDHQQFSPVSVDQRSWRWWQVILIKSWWRMQHICVSCLWWNFPLLV